jgi:hypothetical protein
MDFTAIDVINQFLDFQSTYNIFVELNFANLLRRSVSEQYSITGNLSTLLPPRLLNNHTIFTSGHITTLY